MIVGCAEGAVVRAQEAIIAGQGEAARTECDVLHCGEGRAEFIQHLHREVQLILGMVQRPGVQVRQHTACADGDDCSDEPAGRTELLQGGQQAVL